MPTTRTAGCHSSINEAILSHDRPAPAPAAITQSGREVAPVTLPTATPMRRVPKSKASATPSAVRRPDGLPTRPAMGAAPAPNSGMTRLAGQLQRIDAEQLQRRRKTRPDGCVEDDTRVGLDCQPA